MSRNRILIWYLLCALLLPAISLAATSSSIVPAQLLEILNDKSAQKPLIIDVRAKSDYEKGHIPGAVWVAETARMDSPDIGQRVKSLLADHVAQGGKNEIVVYCFSGYSSVVAVEMLSKLGMQVVNLRYGFNGWSGLADAPVVTD
ncbi:MAG TPA: rhodanese-like domain-containing protein [Firmicutes bacterium]|jgi:rhodanese-related sulfurtransferase|nr:rhodanese-like domain-containing protein [Bacillota bacterium]